MKNYVKCTIALLAMAGSGYYSGAKTVDESTARRCVLRGGGNGKWQYHKENRYH